ncbi:hypothetical protein ACH4F6_39020 [Streptomyces sp. NPDC017936]|uniref:hypothetical protein n=1 Tax=Streptomyces sp. NPDC017936 TaxID=3365016 RepID=UPI0037A9307E
MAVWPNLYAGQRATADLLTSMLPLHAAKTASTSRASTTTISADPDLQLPVVANAQYLLHFYFRISGLPTADMDIQFTTPAGCTGSYAVTGRLAGASAADTDARTSTRIAWNVETLYATPSTTAAQVNHGAGRLITGPTAGTLSVDWAQNISSTTASIMEADSWLELRRIA